MSLLIAFVFIFTGIMAGLFMLLMVKSIFPLSHHHLFQFPTQHAVEFLPVLNIHFINLFLSQHILMIIVISTAAGIIASLGKGKTKGFTAFLVRGAATTQHLMSWIFYFAPLGFFAYFAVLVASAGYQYIQNYLPIFLIYYAAGCIYFFIFFSFYAYLAAPKKGIKTFWAAVVFPSITALSTCSSAASIPANLWASKKIGIPKEIYSIVIPLGAVLHKEGSVLGGVLKIAFLFTLFHIPFFSFNTYLLIIFVSLIVGTIMGAIPSGGMIGEVFILSFYHFPMDALMVIAIISLLIDPLATLLNVAGDCAAGMLIARLFAGKQWCQ